MIDKDRQLMASMAFVLQHLKEMVESRMCTACVVRTGSLKDPALGPCPETLAAGNLIEAYKARVTPSSE